MAGFGYDMKNQRYIHECTYTYMRVCPEKGHVACLSSKRTCPNIAVHELKAPNRADLKVSSTYWGFTRSPSIEPHRRRGETWHGMMIINEYQGVGEICKDVER
jgi:hypothetical protein